MIISDLATGCVVDANPAAITMHGYTRDEFIGLHLTAYIHPDSQRLFIEAVSDSKTRGVFDVPAVHLRRVHRDGAGVWSGACPPGDRHGSGVGAS